MDSTELITDLRVGNLNFKKHAPSVAMFGVNIPLLVLKYRAYLKANIKSVANPVLDFLYLHVFYHMHDRLVENWVTQAIIKIVDNEFEVNDFRTNNLVPINMKSGADNIRKNIALLESKNISVHDFMASELLPGGKSLYQKMESLMRYHVSPPRRQYAFANFLTEFPYVYIYTKLGLLHKSRGTAQSIRKYTTRYLESVKRNNLLDRAPMDARPIILSHMASIEALLI